MSLLKLLQRWRLNLIPHLLLLVGGKVDNLEANVIVEGPDFKISCSLIFHGLFKKSITHRYGSFGGNSQWMLSW